ncbi:MAG TPA: hypothetical protein VGC13_22855 [Longimicrobium sp.]|jgi:hypothetical protein|uniref:hypothetical protein n=1 Tax=Longimicrobium sp. TaxID=2029185 RepID=UPI002ED97B5D
MSAGLVRSIGERARRTGTEVARAQWSALAASAAASPERRPRAIVDAEALVLLSMSLRGREKRLDELVFAWARRGSALLSVQRMTSLAEAFPLSVREALGEFAAQAGDRRWRAHAGPAPDDRPPPRETPLGPLRLTQGPALLLRLRAGFGVGAKADLLAFLLGLRGAPASVSLMAAATGYSGRAMRTAAEEMAMAGFIERMDSAPVTYLADHTAWAAVLRLFRLTASRTPEVPPWRYWSVVFAFLADVDCWAREADEHGWSPYLASSRARDLVADHARAVQLAGLRLPNPEESSGAAFLEDVAAEMDRVHAWCVKNL